jgi:molybdenum cofactor cytidylyltransferase
VTPPGADALNLAILILAAGSAARMRGGDKLLEIIDGQPLLRRQAAMALSLSPQVIVTHRTADPARLIALADLPVHRVPVPDAAEGMAASLRAGAAKAIALNASGLMILPGDMPELTRDDLAQMIAAFDQQPDSIHRAASATGTPGHPVLIPADLIPDLTKLQGDEGARSLLLRHRPRILLHPLPGNHAITDLDTPEEWAAWRASRGE